MCSSIHHFIHPNIIHPSFINPSSTHHPSIYPLSIHHPSMYSSIHTNLFIQTSIHHLSIHPSAHHPPIIRLSSVQPFIIHPSSTHPPISPPVPPQARWRLGGSWTARWPGSRPSPPRPQGSLTCVCSGATYSGCTAWPRYGVGGGGGALLVAYDIRLHSP